MYILSPKLLLSLTEFITCLIVVNPNIIIATIIVLISNNISNLFLEINFLIQFIMSDLQKTQNVISDSMNIKNMDLDNLLLNLKIISNLKEYDKVSVNSENIIIDTPSMFQGIYRTWNGDSRKNTIGIIDSIINRIFEITDELLDEETCNQNRNHIIITMNNKPFRDNVISTFQTIVLQLSETITGLQNLKITYLKDVSITAKIDLIISKIQNRVCKINNLMNIKT